jgi:hypothetical protein
MVQDFPYVKNISYKADKDSNVNIWEMLLNVKRAVSSGKYGW